jgi:phosphoglycerate-specific signal transduction histidine kinase
MEDGSSSSESQQLTFGLTILIVSLAALWAWMSLDAHVHDALMSFMIRINSSGMHAL